jgi:hypothetical protein
MTLFNPQQQQQQVTRFPSGATVAEFQLSATPTVIWPDRSVASNRRGLMVFNDSTANCLFSYGTSISATAFTAELLPRGYIEDSPSAPWQGSVVMRSTSDPTTVNVTELLII